MAENFRIFPPRLQKLGLKLTDCPTEKFRREFLHSLGQKRTFIFANSAQRSTLVIKNCLVDIRLCVHDKRAVAHNRFFDRLTGDQ